MNAIMFDYPLVLLSFTAFIPLVLWDYCAPRRRRIQQRLPQNLSIRLWISRFFFRFFLACVIVALAGPRWGIEQTMGEHRRSLDTVIAIDVSRSMELVDGDGQTGITRLERGLSIVTETVAAIPDTRFAAAISRNRGIVTVPLTWDSGAVLAFLDSADSSITGRGTNLESLVDTAASAFQPFHSATRVILLVSDGEALSGSLKAAIGRCKRDGIIVTAIAVGSDEGMSVDEGRIVLDEASIISRRDKNAMQMAAGQTGGMYIDGNNQDAAKMLTAHLRSLAFEAKTGGNRTEHNQLPVRARWFIFAMLAIIAYGASKLSLLKWGNRE